MTHADLVAVAARWLRKTKGCGVVFTEHTAGFEHPDAMGWKSGFSYLVECKVSRADFFADQKKPGRSVESERPGFKCWYLTPPGLVTHDELPTGWGLLEWNGRQVNVRHDVPRSYDDRDTDTLRKEIYRLYCEVRRYQLHGITYPPLTKRLRPRRRDEAHAAAPLQLLNDHCEEERTDTSS